LFGRGHSLIPFSSMDAFFLWARRRKGATETGPGLAQEPAELAGILGDKRRSLGIGVSSRG
jgi:hypothetical protein